MAYEAQFEHQLFQHLASLCFPYSRQFCGDGSIYAAGQPAAGSIGSSVPCAGNHAKHTRYANGLCANSPVCTADGHPASIAGNDSDGISPAESTGRDDGNCGRTSILPSTSAGCHDGKHGRTIPIPGAALWAARPLNSFFTRLPNPHPTQCISPGPNLHTFHNPNLFTNTSHTPHMMSAPATTALPTFGQAQPPAHTLPSRGPLELTQANYP